MLRKKSFEAQLTQLSLLASLPIFVLLILVMSYAEISLYIILLTALWGCLSLAYCHGKIHQKSAYQFRSLSNLLDAMIQGDYSLRARPSQGDEALNELVDSINGLAERLNKQHIASIESQLLLRTVINHIDVAIIALNEKNQPVLVNPAANKLLKLPLADLSQSSPLNSHLNPPLDSSLEPFKQLSQLGKLESGQNQVMSLTFGSQQGKFNVHMEEFRESGKQQKLLFLTDVSTLLRSEERNAWQSLVRVISHEINNSLTPIASISQTLKRFLEREQDVASQKENLLEGLGIIAQRTNNLKNFVNSYKQIARLPEPEKQPTSIVSLVNKIIPLFQPFNVTIDSTDDIELFIDPVQIEQVLINLIKNAVEAVQATGIQGTVKVSWTIKNQQFQLTVNDEGTGVSNLDNLFVPLYTTKKEGSGIGLVLCRQILEVHGGQLTLNNKEQEQGCLAVIELPIVAANQV